MLQQSNDFNTFQSVRFKVYEMLETIIHSENIDFQNLIKFYLESNIVDISGEEVINKFHTVYWEYTEARIIDEERQKEVSTFLFDEQLHFLPLQWEKCFEDTPDKIEYSDEMCAAVISVIEALSPLYK